MSRFAVLFTLVLLAPACGSLTRLGIGRRLPSLDAATRLDNFLEEVHLARLDRSPESRARLGLPETRGAWDDRSAAYAAESAELLRADLARLADEFGTRRLAPDALRLRNTFERATRDLLDAHAWSGHTYAVTQVHGPQVEVPHFLAEVQRLETADDARIYVQRLHAARAVFEQAVANIERRRAEGVLAPRALLAHARSQCTALLADEHAWLDEFSERLGASELPSQAALLADAQAAIDTSVRPGLMLLAQTLDTQLEFASSDLGVWRLPRGRAFYINLVARRASPAWTPDELHALGRREVERLHGELQRVAEEVGFTGSVANFLAFLREDPGLAWGSSADAGDEWMRLAESALGAARGDLSQVLSSADPAPLVVRATRAAWPGLDGVVGYGAATTAPHASGALLVRRDRVALLPRFLVAAQAHSAGLPGQHLLTSRARSRLELPRPIRFGTNPAHEQGWGLYAAALADELDADRLPYARAGRLAQELWCAALMVVDTGLHTRRWERRQAVDYLLRSTCYPESICDAAVLRCAAQPAHAVSAAVGLVTLRNLRARAESELGEAFEPRAFHAAVLDAGPLPLDILKAHVNEWLESVAP